MQPLPDGQYPCQGFYVTERRLNVGDIVAPGRWGSVLARFGRAHARFATEQLLEVQRCRAHPKKPSRLESNFCFSTIDEARWYRDTHHRGQAIYEIGFDADAYAVHQGFILCLPPNDNMTDEQAVESYWLCNTRVFDAARPEIAPLEIVTRSPMQVRRKIE